MTSITICALTRLLRRNALTRKACASFLLVLMSILLSACSVLGEVSLDTYLVPLTVSIDSKGDISFEVKSGIEVPTPIGVVTAAVVIDPSEEYGVPNTLVLRVAGDDHIFDLHGEDFRVEVASGYYDAVNLHKIGQNLILELEKTSDGTPNAITIPLFWHKRFEAASGYADMIIEKIVLTSTEATVYVDFKVHNRPDYEGTLQEYSLVDSCLCETYREPIGFLWFTMPGHPEERDYGALRAKAVTLTSDRDRGYVVFSRGILRQDATYRLCFACEHRGCSDPLPIR